MLVEKLLQVSHRRLVTIPDDTTLIKTAKLLRPGTDLVVVCGSTGLLAGVITKTDVVNQFGQCQGASCTAAVSLVMTRDVAVLPSRRFASRGLVENEGARLKERSYYGS